MPRAAILAIRWCIAANLCRRTPHLYSTCAWGRSSERFGGLIRWRGTRDGGLTPHLFCAVTETRSGSASSVLLSVPEVNEALRRDNDTCKAAHIWTKVSSILSAL